MGQIEVIRRDGTTVPLFSKEPFFCTVKSAQLTKALMGDDYIKLSIVSSEKMEFAKGDKIVYGGDEYFVRTIPSTTLQSENNFVTEVTFYGVIYDMMKSLYRNTDQAGNSSTGNFDLTYGLKDFIKVIVYNLERDYPGLWAFDEQSCPETTPKTMAFNNQNCLNAIQTICKEFDYEFLIRQTNGVRTIHIGKFGSRIAPPGGSEFFEYGKGCGLFSLKEDKIDDKAIITRLWVEGGTTNIRSGYRNYAGRLQLPYPKRLNRNRHTLWDGSVVEPNTELIGIDSEAKRYIEDEALRNAIGSDEDGYQNDEIYPKRTGRVTAKVDGDECSFIDTTMDFDLNEKENGETKYMASRTSAKITFITGRLAGQQFELESYDDQTKKFKIIPYTDERGLTVPTTDTEAFRFAQDDEYKLTDVFMPDTYERDAEEELWYDGFNNFKPRTQARVQYTLTLDRSYFLENLPSDGDVRVFDVGDYVPVKDERFSIEKTIRVCKLTRNILIEQDYQLTLADEATITVMTQAVLDVINHEQVIQTNRLRDLNRAKRGWRTTEELRTMVYDTDGFFDVDNIRPNSIDTNMLTVGSKSQQFVLTGVVIEPNYQGNKNVIHISSGVLSHLSISDTEIKTWNMAELDMTLTSNNGYYVFAKCSKSGNNGTWYVSQEQLKVENNSDPNNYYFQVGILGSIQDSDTWRDFVTTHGFTRINGNTITTGRIVTSDGGCYLDLDGNKFRIGDNHSYIDFNSNNDKKLALHNVVLVSDSGDSNPIGVYRGVFNSTYIYYTGDEVSYTNGAGETYTIRYINPEPSVGSNPEDSNFWAIVARGGQGEQGKSIFYTFHDQQTQPNTPTGSGDTDGWHTNSTSAVIWMSMKAAKTIEEGTWGVPIRVRGADGTSVSIKGTLTNVSQLPTTGNSPGDSYLIGGYLYVWDGTSWDNVGQIKGDSSYLHMKWSNDGGTTFTDGNGETPGRYVGLMVDQSPHDSDNPRDYKWRDTQGEQGIPGLPGEDGRTPYFHIKYSNDGGMSFTGNNGEDPGDWIGQYTDYEVMDSGNPSDYTWSCLRGSSGDGGADATSPEYYEYRYAKNGSTTTPPDLDPTASEPDGWSLEQPPLGYLEYLWMTVAKKESVGSKSMFHIPINAKDATRLVDTSGHNINGTIGAGASLVEDGGRVCLRMKNGEATIPKDLPFGTSFTLCLWLKTDQDYIQWLLNGFMGRDYVENKIAVTQNSWVHLAFRFNGNSLVVFKNAEEVQRGSVNYHIDGFSLYDDNMFESVIHFDEVRLLKGALSDVDIAKIMNGNADRMVSNWSEPVRTTPYDAISVTNVDVEYAISDSNSDAPQSGWQTAAPVWVDGKYIWSRTKTEYSRGEPTFSDAVCITGGKGGTGNGVRSITEQYYKSNSSSSLDGGSWQDDRPEWQDGWYIWTRSKILYTNSNTPQYTEAICVTGHKGNNGENGKDGLSVNVNLLDGTNFVKNFNKWTSRCIVVNGMDGNQAAYSENTSSASSYYEMLSQKIYGDTNKLEPGEWYTLSFWAKGVGKMRTHFYPSVIDYSVNGFVDGVEKPLNQDAGLYDWELDESFTFHKFTFKAASFLLGNKWIYFRLFGGNAATICMPKLEKGKDATAWCLSEIDKVGVSYSGTDEYYKWSTNGLTAPSNSGWTLNAIPDKPGENYKYLWNYEVIHADDGTTKTTAKHLVGSDGKGIKQLTESYMTTEYFIIPEKDDENWSSEMPKTTDTHPYLWNKELVEYTDGTSDTKIHLIAQKGVVNKNLLDGTGFMSNVKAWNRFCGVREDGLDGEKALYCSGFVTDVDIEYAASSNGTTAPTTGWSSAPNSVITSTTYLWGRVVSTIKGDGTNTIKHYSSAFLVASRANSTVVKQWYLSTSGTTQTGGSWLTTKVQWENGKRVWMRCSVRYTIAGATQTSTTTAVVNPQDGNSHYVEMMQQVVFKSVPKIESNTWYTLSFWAKGVGTLKTYIYPSAVPASSKHYVDGEEYSITPTDGLHNWSLDDSYRYHTYTFKTKSTITDEDQKVLFRVWDGGNEAHVCMPKLEKGMEATSWCLSEDDKIGVSYVGKKDYYQWGRSDTEAPTDTWTLNDIPAKPGDSHIYLWNYEVIMKDDGSEIQTTPHRVGSDGRGISNVTEYYMISNSNVAPAANHADWSEVGSNGEIPDPTDAKKYLWNKEHITYTDGTQADNIHLIAKKGDKGDQGECYDGVDEYYLTTNASSGVTRENGSWGTWRKNEITPLSASAKYLWNYEVYYTYDPSTGTRTPQYTTPAIIGVFGKDGRGISNVTEYYLASESNSGITNATAGFTTKIQTLTATKRYLWNYEVISYSDGSTPTKTSAVIIGVYGDKGEPGANGLSPALVYRGVYDSNATYYGNAYRVDAVKYGNAYYVSRVDAGTFSGTTPSSSNNAKWNPFGSTFESIATMLLLAENANIAGWIFRNNRLESADGNVFLDGINGTISINGASAKLISATGRIVFGGESFNTTFQSLSETRSVTINGAPNGYFERPYNFTYNENRKVHLAPPNPNVQNWLNITIADIMDIPYYNIASNTTPNNRYGFQFAMLGTGHVVQDGIVEGACLDTVTFTAKEQIQVIQTPFWCNRVAVSTNYAECHVILPDIQSISTTLGLGIITRTTRKKFSFRMTIINVSSEQSIYINGRNSQEISGSATFNVAEYPAVYNSSGSYLTAWKSLALAKKRVINVLLVYDGATYYAFVE